MFDTARDGLDVDAPFHAVANATTSSVSVGANAPYSSHLPSEQVVVGARQFDGRDLSALTTNRGGSTRAAPTYAGECLNASSGRLTPGAASCSRSIRRSGDSGLNSWHPMGEPVPFAPLATGGTGRADYLYLGHFAGWPYLLHAGTGRPFHVRADDGVARPASDRELNDLEAAEAVTRISESTMQRRVRYLRSFARLADSQDKVAHPAAIKRSHEPGGDMPDANTSSGFCGRGAR